MSITSGELQAAGALMFAAYVAAGALGVGPSVAKRRRTAGAHRARGHVPRASEAAWGAVQAFTALATLVCAALPEQVLSLHPPGLGLAQPASLAVGAALFVAGAALTGWAARSLDRQLTAAIEVREGDELVTRGPYARVRHPVYTGIFLMAGGLAVALPGAATVAVLAVALAVGQVRARAEEELLARPESYGDSYREYSTRTGRFLPRRQSQRGVK